MQNPGQRSVQINNMWRVLPLGEWVSQGMGSLRLPLRVRCRNCSELGQLQVRPPVPTRVVGGWIAPP